jgi:hypothetical protein
LDDPALLVDDPCDFGTLIQPITACSGFVEPNHNI